MRGLRFFFGVALFSLGVFAAAAQDGGRANDSGPFGQIERWLDGVFRGARKDVDQFDRDASHAARETGDALRSTGDAVANLPNTRVISGHQSCPMAANRAPDCVQAANELCRKQGFRLGKSVDVTTAEECPAAVRLGYRPAQPGDCRNVSFVTRAVCQ